MNRSVFYSSWESLRHYLTDPERMEVFVCLGETRTNGLHSECTRSIFPKTSVLLKLLLLFDIK